MENKVNTSIYITQEIRDFCKDNHINLSKWIDSRFSEEFLTISALQKKIDYYQLEARTAEKQLHDRMRLSKEEVEEIKQMPRNFEQHNKQEVIKYFNRKFNKNYSPAEIETFIRIHCGL